MWLRRMISDGTVLVGPGPQEGGLQGVEVVGRLADVVDGPPVGGEPLGGVVVEAQLGGPVDGDVVVVVDVHQPAEAQVTGQRGRLVGDALLEAPVAGHHVGVVVAQLGREVGAQPPLGDPECRRRWRTPWPSGPVVTSTPAVWCRSGCPGVALPQERKAREVVERQPVPRQVEHGVEEDRGVPVGQDEPVAVRPVGVGRVVAQDPGEQDVGQRGERHGRPRVARVGRPRARPWRGRG